MESNSNIFQQAILRINRGKIYSRISVFVIGFLRSIFLALIAVGLWEMIRPGSLYEEAIIFVSCFVFGLVTSARKARKKVTSHSFLKYLEFTYPKTKSSPFSLNARESLSSEDEDVLEWQSILEKEVQQRIEQDRRETRAFATSLVVPFVLLSGVVLFAPNSVTSMLSGVTAVVSRLTWGAELTVVDGVAEERPEKSFALTTSNPESIVLLEQNLIRINLVGARQGVRHIVQLKPKSGAGGQSFQLTETLDSKIKESNTGSFSLTFSVNQSADLFISSISDSKPVATIDIKKLPVPVVTLEPVLKPLKDPWPDDRPLKLKITAKAENPLDKIRLVIQTGGTVANELVANILAEDKLYAESEYDLIIEPYMKADIAEVTVIAEAIDRSLPKPLLGRSPPLRVTAASAYGRYQRTLQTLRELKTLFDNTIEENHEKLDRKAREIVAEVQIQAQDSPFFDQFDRAKLFNFDRKTNALLRKFDKEGLLELSGDVNDFLFEHEAVDFRERDRDFFVAVRGLSRLLEQPRAQRPIKTRRVTERINNYLEERRRIWKVRVGRIAPELVPKEYNRIEKRQPFKTAMNDVASLDEKNTKKSDTDALQKLSKTAAEYRSWIQKLEKAEDDSRKKKEQKRQKGLSSARNELKELQKRQSEISSILDKAGEQDQKKLEENWPSTKMKQTTNAEKTRRLENNLRSLSPLAAKRMEFAFKSMNQAVGQGDGQKFQQAESSSDAAARLLRQAESAAKKSQRRKGGSRGRRRRVSGDNYYGRSITGGDIEINRVYSVDQRYRGEILKEVRSLQNDENLSKDDKNLMESYLRKVVR